MKFINTIAILSISLFLLSSCDKKEYILLHQEIIFGKIKDKSPAGIYKGITKSDRIWIQGKEGEREISVPHTMMNQWSIGDSITLIIQTIEKVK